jgi:hypothetical protein
MEESVSMKRDFPKMMSTPEAAAFLAGKPRDCGNLSQSEFLRFAEKYGIAPMDEIGCGSRNRGESTVRWKWSRAHIELCLLTGLPFREALKWAQGAKLMIV